MDDFSTSKTECGDNLGFLVGGHIYSGLNLPSQTMGATIVAEYL